MFQLKMANDFWLLTYRAVNTTICHTALIFIHITRRYYFEIECQGNPDVLENFKNIDTYSIKLSLLIHLRIRT